MGQPNQGAKLGAGFKLLTANRLGDGAVLFWTGESWADDVRRARQLVDADVPAALDGAAQEVAARRLVEPYAVEAAPDGLPLRLRERIRAVGPTVRPDLAREVQS
jgi:hypothetical protein